MGGEKTIDKKEALRLRLVQLDQNEISILREFQLEREMIYSSLRKLSRQERSNETLCKKNKIPSHIETFEQVANDLKTFNNNNMSSKSTQQSIHKISRGIKKKRRKGRGESEASREAALKILKQYDKPISSIDLKKYIEKETGGSISNMTAFMNHLMKIHTEVRKPCRGQYIWMKT
ncbi:hypothetical protein ACIRN9_06695 [Bacillus velezensis]|uniref:Rok-like winged helix domain-containing protein n=1 Tax=Bacillus velezensis TaxID=492670 RepID=UPI001FB20DD1|nr:hypothetical protein [Bacillus velezensis]UOF66549.1 hypothetical protein MTX90_10600 [Bacillus velezensis]